jgi:hypothetical protein
MAIKKYITIVMTTLCIFSCEEESSIPLNSKNTNLLVVEGIVTNENIQHTVRLSLPFTAPNGKPVPVTNAVITISDGQTTIPLTASDSGRYSTPQMRFLTGVMYTLTINYNGKQYTAADRSVPVESMGALSYANVEGGYRLNLFDTGSQPNYIEYTIDWRNTSACVSSCEARIIYYDLKTVDAHEIFKPGKTDFTFPSQSTVIRRKFSMSDAYRTFLRSMLSETQWRGSVFDIQHDNAPTNLSEGAIGFFAVSTVVADTVKVP